MLPPKFNNIFTKYSCNTNVCIKFVGEFTYFQKPGNLRKPWERISQELARVDESLENITRQIQARAYFDYRLRWFKT